MKFNFSSLTRERMREIASMGGKAVHAKGVGREFDSDGEEAREAGQKGYEALAEKFSSNEEKIAYFSMLGKKSVAARRANKNKQQDKESVEVNETI